MTTIAMPPPVRARQAIDRIAAWPYWHDIEKVAKKEYGVTEQRFAELLPEYQRFLGLIALGHSVAMYSEDVDLLWHSHILHTQRYAEFCQHVIGHFVHHTPNLTTQAVSQCEAPPTPPPSNCEAPPTPAPQCVVACEYSCDPRDSVPPTFIDMYFQAYGELPGPVWQLSAA